MSLVPPGDLEVVHLKKGEVLLGVLIVDDADFPWLHCTFAPSDAFASLRPFFDHELNVMEDEGYDAWKVVYERVSQLGLRLVDADTQKELGPIVLRSHGHRVLLHIRGDRAWFRY